MLLNEKTYTLSLRRIDICNLLIACTSIEYGFEPGSGSAKKWERIHDLLKEQLNAQDAEHEATEEE